MASSNTALRVTELDFDSIKNNLKTFLHERSGFTDANFEGSNWSLFLDILAYNSHYMGYYVNAVANEMFLDTAQLRDSVLSHAKLVGYVPTSKRASTAYVNIRVTPGNTEDQTQSVLTLNRYVRMVSDTEDGKSLIFVVDESDTATKANGAFLFSNVAIKQGDVITSQAIFEQSVNTSRRFNIPSANVDTSTLSVRVQRSLVNSAVEIYTQAADITEVTANSTVYYLEENPESNGSYSIIFGDNYLGKKPANSSIIIMTYLDTLGPAGDDVNGFTLLDDIGGYSSNVIINVVSASSAGSLKEAIDTIKFRAPIYYTAQNRAVTTQDFEAILIKDYPNIQAVSVWGGQDNDPPIYGKIFISLLPRNGYYLTVKEKQRIIDEIVANRSVVTMTPEIVDPEILYLALDLKVRYNPTETTYSKNALKALIRAEILTYKDEELVDFNDKFRSSVLLRRIDSIDRSIKATELDLYVQKRVELTPNTTSNYTVEFGIPLKPGGVFDKITTYPALTFIDLADVNRDCLIEEDSNTVTGITSITTEYGGTNYITSPTVTINGDGVGATAKATIVNGSVSKITVANPGTGYTQATVTLTGGKGRGATATAILQADRATLYSFYYATSGRKMLVSSDVGNIRYDLGTVTLTNFSPISVVENDRYSENILTITAIPDSTVISSNRNKIVSIDGDDASAIRIEMITES